MSHRSNHIHIDQPVRVRSYHHWTVRELEALDSKPKELQWKEWLPKIGLSNVKCKTAIHRWMRYRAEKEAKQSAALQCTPEPRKASHEAVMTANDRF